MTDRSEDSEAYMERVELWGRRDGIVQDILPEECTKPRLAGIELKHPIEQHVVGKTRLSRQQIEERRHTRPVWDWAAMCAKDGLRAPPSREVVQAELNARRRRRARKGEDTTEDKQEQKICAGFAQAAGARAGNIKTA
ncbi:hypothetical protein FRC09_003133 [Ceratobasidium sp. 395]|nr:hypothetical protein FRC09_003133 [Ceratobasidium sp. 395]